MNSNDKLQRKGPEKLIIARKGKRIEDSEKRSATT